MEMEEKWVHREVSRLKIIQTTTQTGKPILHWYLLVKYSVRPNPICYLPKTDHLAMNFPEILDSAPNL